MKFHLDVDKRFHVEARDVGWDLVVDGRLVHYARTLRGILDYVDETLREEARAENVDQVLKRLDEIKGILARAADVVIHHQVAASVASIIPRLQKFSSHRDRVREASLALAGCDSVPELKALVGHQHFVNMARALVSGAESA